ncbi:MAG: flagellar motor stator protein MotA [Candidatus Magnetoovum sp. WYHC-5]|nr:flagellar motor stator protein MotA [Candidatus Magnetoovum sp. WYHC-5]
MTAIIGIVIVTAAVFSGYLMAHGNLAVLVQPAEFLIILGAAFGSLVLSSPPAVIKLVVKNFKRIFQSGGAKKEDFLELLSLMFLIFSKIRKEGLISIEADVELPEKSPIFTKYKSVLDNKKALNFICDNLRVIITTNMPTHELDELLSTDIESSAHEEMLPSYTLQKMADALPGLGIVAAVLGVVITMGHIDAPPTVLGYHIGAALTGTFLGVLMCYGYVGPMATNLELKAKEGEVYFTVIKVSLVSFVGGAAPQIAIESGRRAIPNLERPAFAELEEAVKK